MPKKISDEKISLIGELYAQGLTVAEVARRAGVSYVTGYGYMRARERGFASRNDYEEHLARARGFASRTGYLGHLARERGFASLNEYRGHLAKKRQQKPENQSLSNLIRTRLDEIGKNRVWVAGQLNLAQTTISAYATGKILPSAEKLELLFHFLEVPYKTLDELVKAAAPE